MYLKITLTTNKIYSFEKIHLQFYDTQYSDGQINGIFSHSSRIFQTAMLESISIL